MSAFGVITVDKSTERAIPLLLSVCEFNRHTLTCHTIYKKSACTTDTLQRFPWVDI